MSNHTSTITLDMCQVRGGRTLPNILTMVCLLQHKVINFMKLQSFLKHNHLVGKHAFSIKTKFNIEIIKNLALTLKNLSKGFRVKKITLSSLGYSTS